MENFLAGRRAHQIDKLIPASLRGGKILDIGCGSLPFFLSRIGFKEKYGLDKSIEDSQYQGIALKNFEIKIGKGLPFPDDHFEAVTMLAVIEHLEAELSEYMMRECFRVLNRGGLLLITTPPGRVDRLLRLLARLNLVSKEEIAEHKQLFVKSGIARQLKAAGFKEANIKIGNWQMGLNLYAVARK